MAIAAITFDFWCTLFRDANGVARQAMRVDAFSRLTGIEGVRVEAVLADVWRVFDRHHRQQQRTLTPMDAVQYAAVRLGIELSPEVATELSTIFATAIVHFPAEPIEDALEAVRAASSCLPVALISDTGVSPGSSLKSLLAQGGFLPHFSALTFSDEVGVSKPHALMFETTAKALGVAPNELLHIGDREDTDVQGAKGVGALAVLFAGDNDTDVPVTTADHTFFTWQEFENALPLILEHSSGTHGGA